MNTKSAFFLSLTLLLLAALLLTRPAAPAASLFAPQGGHSAYLPVVFRPPSQDLTISVVEITQSVQRANNSVPLVKDRNTIVRVYATAPVQGPVSSVVVRLSAVRNGVLLGHVDSAPVTIPVAATRSNLNSTVNFQLQAAWLSGSVNLTATVDPSNTVIETNEGNNSLATTMNFNNVPDLQVKIVPINYTHTGPTQPGFYPAQPVDYISDWIMRAYPVDNVAITIRTPYNFSGNLQTSTAWQNSQGTGLLNRMYQLKLADGHPEDTPIIYYGFVPINNGASQWFSSGIAGIGWVGYRESVGLNLGQNDMTGTLAGHEIGHNMGRAHAPCGNPANPDPSYPYPGASIGEYGIDIPQGVFWGPSTAVDVMSYCDPAWLSDYTYIALYNDQIINGAAIAPTSAESMVVVAGLADDGAVTLTPTYAFTSYPSTAAESDYQVQLLDKAGNVLLTQTLKVREAVEEGVSGRLLTAVLPLADRYATAVRIVTGATVLAEQQLTPAADLRRQKVSATRQGDVISLAWGLADTPAIVRYSPDGGQTWHGLGIGVLGGTFAVEAAALPTGNNGLFEIILANSNRPAILQAVLP